jgi:tRNA G18 (ribose-2'-O)-methylase SpoU
MARIIKVDSVNVSELDAYVRMTEAQLKNKLCPEKSIFIAESPTVIEVAIQGGCVPVSFLTDERLLGEGVMKIADKYPDIPMYVATRDELTKLTGFELTRGMLAAMRRPEPKTVEEVCKGKRRIAVLEGITDTTNIGAIFRSAAALGIDAVLTTPNCCDPLNRRAVRVSMGTIFLVPWAVIGKDNEDWEKNGQKILNDLGYKTVAMALSNNTVDIDDEALAGEEALAIILGTEGTGLQRNTIERSDYTVKIPMSNCVDSLNVGAAAAIAFWELTHKSK